MISLELAVKIQTLRTVVDCEFQPNSAPEGKGLIWVCYTLQRKGM
ncbi:hypothetical protein [Myxacorys almedinensis]|nr:hypothetical protein [Myxacorys almedinensis]